MAGKAYSMTHIAPTVSAVLRIPAPAQATRTPIKEICADLAGANEVAILVPDAFGLFAWNLWKAEMPYLSALHARRSLILQSVMPSITPVNFATMVTGADQNGHGIHTFNDAFACETLFDVVRQSRGKSAGVGLDDCTGCKLLGRFADICGNAGLESDDGVVDKIVEIADKDQPEFLIAQLGKVDYFFHKYGPSSPKVVPMLKETDARLKRLVEHLKPLGYGIIILADHGQHDVINPAPGEHKGLHGTDASEDCLVPCTWV